MKNDQDFLNLYRKKRILFVDDRYFLSDEVRRKLTDLKAVVIGPVANVEDALALIDGDRIDAAILDVHLSEHLLLPVAERLESVNVPFVFAMGYDPLFIIQEYRGFALCEKPVELAKIAIALWMDEPDGLH